jgi:hypothetical protein
MHIYAQIFARFAEKTAAVPLAIRRVTARDLALLCFILLIGGLIRFSNPQVIDWSSDHSDMSMMAQDIVDGKGIPLVGQPSSAGLPHSPFYIYILTIPYAITDDPIGVTMFITALSLVGVSLLWLIAFRYIGPTVALVAGLAYAVNPWAVSFSRTIWSGDHRAPLLLLGVLLGLHGFVEGKRWAQILCLPVMLIALQIHYAAWALLPLYFWLVWMGRSRTSWRTLAISVLLGALVMLPLTIGMIQFLNASATAPGSIQAQTRSFSLRDMIKPYGQMVWLATGLGSEQYSARDNAADLLAQARMPTFLWVLQGVALLIGLFSLWTRYPRQLAILLSIWAFLPLLAFTLPIIGVFPHYFIPVIPALYLLVGLGVKWLLDWLGSDRRLLRGGVWAVYGAIVATQGLFVLATLKYVDTHFTPSQFGFGTPIHYMMNARDELRKHNDIVFIDSSDWLDFSRTNSWLWAPFLRDTTSCLRDVQVGSGVAVLPAGPFTAVFAPRAPVDPVLTQLYQTNQPTVFTLRPDEGTYSLNSFDTARAWSGPAFTPIAPVRFENGVQLLGYRLEGNRLMLEWRLPASTKGDYQYTVDLLSTDDKILTQYSAAFWPSKNWCQGDRLITWGTVDTAVEAQTLRVHMLRNRGTAAVHVLDQAGRVAGAEALIKAAQ